MWEGPNRVERGLFERTFATPSPQKDVHMTRQVGWAVATELTLVQSGQAREENRRPKQVRCKLRNDARVLSVGPITRFERVRKRGNKSRFSVGGARQVLRKAANIELVRFHDLAGIAARVRARPVNGRASPRGTRAPQRERWGMRTGKDRVAAQGHAIRARAGGNWARQGRRLLQRGSRDSKRVQDPGEGVPR